MMMPANYSVIAENEMSYVNGGVNFIEAIGAVTAPIWGIENIKTFNTNLVTIIGNAYVEDFVKNTIGVIFSGNTTKDAVGDIFGVVVGKDKFKNSQYGDGIATILGNMAAIYNLGVVPTKNKVKEHELTFDVL